jgi:hypothetical protein
MCMGDWRLGRLIRHQVTAWSTGAGTGLTILPNQQRVGISITIATLSVTTATVVLSIDQIAANLMSNNVPFRHLTLLDYGQLPTRRFDVAAGVGTASGVWIEYFAQEDMLAIPFEELKRIYQPWAK